MDQEKNLFGPAPLSVITEKPKFKFSGEPQIPGEAEAMGEYVKDNKRIPRRGELISAKDISKFEVAGYVMSGSNNRKMTAARLRKESQLYSAEEKRLLSQIKVEEQIKRENELIATFRTYVASEGANSGTKDDK
eukprot:TRINITY_DN5473_c0_g1_i2.p1 TRINITY_DN5473_c0_g1~~TRINITY_DN5473_c0_g1_i2.p1  ORF type:complete len:134 (+),score=39.93 TRINITY_DN5473_c0_g1_i2:301-702(+)